MKFIILCSLIALAIAAPREDTKYPLSSTSTLDANKPTLASDQKAKTPIANPSVAINKPLTKRDAPTKTDQKNSNTPINNAQKNSAAPSPITSDTAKKPSNARPSRDTPKTPLTSAQNPSTPQKQAAPAPSTVQKTQSNGRNRRDTQTQQNSYKPQASGVPQKTNSPPSPSVASTDSQKTNARPSRDTVKTPLSNTPQVGTNQQKNSAPTVDSTKTSSNNKRPSRDTPKTPLTSAQNPSTPQKQAAPVPSTVQKTQSNSRNRRDTPVKPVESNQKPVEWNKNEKKVSAQQPSTDNRKTRETPKASTNTQLKDDKTKTANPVQHPEVARVPLTNTNARNRRDAPNPAEQSKLVPSGTTSAKQYVAPASQAHDTPTKTSTTNASGNKRDTEKLNIRQPVPVDQIVKQKTNSNVNPASDNLKPVENVNKKV